MGLFSWLTCREFCRRASRSADGDLRWYDVPGYVFHYLMCFSCRRYRSQIDVMDKTVCGCKEELYEEDSSDPDDTLSEGATLRIKELLTKEVSQDR